MEEEATKWALVRRQFGSVLYLVDAPRALRVLTPRVQSVRALCCDGAIRDLDG